MSAAETVPVRVGFVLHAMNVAGAEMLVLETIRRLGARIRPVVFCLDKVGTMGEWLRSDGIPVIAYGRRPGMDLTVAWRMAADIRAHRVDVLHAHQYTPFFYSALAGRLSRVRPQVIFTEHGRHFPDGVSSRRRLINRLVFDRLADHVNAVCEFSARSLSVVDGFSPARIEVIPNGVDAATYAATADVRASRAHVGLDPDRRYVVAIARFHPVKDHKTLVRAFAEVANTVPDVDLLLAGDGELRTELTDLAQRLGIAARVRFLGIRTDVPALLQAADVFALTSLSEAASITLLEAMASAVPVVATAVGGNPELVRDDVDGCLVPRGDCAAVAAAIVKLLREPALAQKLGRAAQERVRTTFRLADTVARYYGLYAGTVAARRAA
jgi:glycosyltransferase involved in cell wall biosynthesis